MSTYYLDHYKLPSYYDNCSQLHISADCMQNQLYTLVLKLIKNDSNAEQLRTVWTCAEIADYCSRMDSLSKIMRGLQNLQTLGDAISPATINCTLLGPVSLVFGLLLFATLFWLKGRVFWFLKCIAAGQLVQSIYTTANRGYMSNDGFWKLFWSKILVSSYFYYFAKTFCTSMAFFMALDRYLCICYTIKYEKMNWKRYFLGTCVFSFFIGVLQLIPLKLIMYDSDSHAWYMLSTGGWVTTVQKVWFPAYIDPFLVAYQVSTIVLCFAFSMRIIVVLRRRAKEVAAITLGDYQAAKKRNHTIFLCRIQLVDALALSIDLLALILYNLSTASIYLTPVCTTQECFYPQPFKKDSSVRLGLAIMYMVGFNLEGTCHAELFFLYLIFFNRFRLAFKKMWLALYAKVKALARVIGLG